MSSDNNEEANNHDTDLEEVRSKRVRIPKTRRQSNGIPNSKKSKKRKPGHAGVHEDAKDEPRVRDDEEQ
jgi:hypothetical protein